MDKIVFYKDQEKTIINQEKTDNYLKSINELLKYLETKDDLPNMKILDNVINEISNIYLIAQKDYVEYTEKGTDSPKSASIISGVKPRMFNQYEVNQIKQYKEMGLSNYKIARKFDCSEKTIRNYLKE